MAEIQEYKRTERARNRRAHMANERTYLAWIRTSIAIMAFGFVVEKFALFIKQVSYILGREVGIPTRPVSYGYSSIFGIFLVGLGTLMGMLAFIRYKKVEKQIDEDTYLPSPTLDIMLVMSILAIGTFLILYLIYSI